MEGSWRVLEVDGSYTIGSQGTDFDISEIASPELPAGNRGFPGKSVPNILARMPCIWILQAIIVGILQVQAEDVQEKTPQKNQTPHNFPCLGLTWMGF